MRALNSAYLIVIPIALVFFLNSKNTASVKKNVNIKILSMLLLIAPFIQNTYAQWFTQTSGTASNIVSVFFINTTTGWAAGEDGYIARTTNGGTNWVQQTSNTNNALICAVFADASTGWVSGTFGTVLKTTNGGTNWTSLTTAVSGALRISFVNISTGWAVGATGTIIKTTNGGANWTTQSSGTSSFLLNVKFLDANTGWACGQSGVILKTTNGGTNWTTQTTGSTQSLFGLFFSNSSTGWTAGGSGNIYYTTNGGTNWSAQSAGTTDEFYSVHFPNSTTGWLSGSNGKIYVTSNGGTNWQLQSSSTTETLNSIFFGNAEQGWVVGGNGVIRVTSNSGGLNSLWSEQTSGVATHLYSVSAVSSTTCWAGGTNGVVLRTTNSGTNWINVSGSPIGANIVNLVVATDANTCIAATNTTIYKTSNAGANWIQVFTQSGGYIDDIGFMNATTGFMYGDALGGRWSLWKTTNAGTTWDSTGLYLAQSGSELGWYNAMFISGNNIWFGTDNSRIYKSTNFGTNWSFNPTPIADSYCISFNGTTGFVAGDSVLMKSTNSGVNWSGNFIGDNPGYDITSIKNTSGKWWVTRADTIFTSTNGGTSFAFQRKGINRYWDMSFVTEGSTIRGWAVKNNGGIESYFEALTGTGSSNTTEIPKKYLLRQNYPNPFNPVTKIKFEIPVGNSDNVKLIVFDVLGKEVSTLVNENLSAGSYEAEFDAVNLSSGTYFYMLVSGEYRDVKKMVLIK